MARVILGVRGMNTPETVEKVKKTLSEINGIEKVDANVDQQATVVYDESSITVMDLIRTLRRAGFLAGME
ncbi:MAG: heavy-metal-associated domain-containing protein [Trueperaceae bacterium]|nr:heavy-metal-associated domain-containing protein [Trueperaceae bacterium]